MQCCRRKWDKGKRKSRKTRQINVTESLICGGKEKVFKIWIDFYI